MGRMFILVGLFLVVVGFGFMLAERFGIRSFRLPGDIRIEGKNGSVFYFPVVTCILLSIVLSLVGRFFQGR